jgi:hypothetical protein
MWSTSSAGLLHILHSGSPARIMVLSLVHVRLYPRLAAQGLSPDSGDLAGFSFLAGLCDGILSATARVLYSGFGWWVRSDSVGSHPCQNNCSEKRGLDRFYSTDHLLVQSKQYLTVFCSTLLMFIASLSLRKNTADSKTVLWMGVWGKPSCSAYLLSFAWDRIPVPPDPVPDLVANSLLV